MGPSNQTGGGSCWRGRLQQVEAPILGTVLNRYETKGDANYLYGYDRSSEAAESVDDSPSTKQATVSY